MDGDHQYGDVGEQFSNLAANVQPIQIGHLEVQYDDIRRIFLNPLQCFYASGDLRINPPASFQFQKASKIVAHRRIVICNQNPNQTILPFDDLQRIGIPTLGRMPAVYNTVNSRTHAATRFPHQIPLSLPVSFNSSAAAVANPGSKLRRNVFRISPFSSNLFHSEA